MKKIIYILAWLLLLVSCANNTDYPSKVYKEETSETTENFDKKINIVKQPEKPVEQQAEHKEEQQSFNQAKNHVDISEERVTQSDFDEAARQKIQQVADIYILLGKKTDQNDFNSFAKKHLQKMWLHPDKSLSQLQKTGWQKYDSIRLIEIHLIKQDKLLSPTRVASYSLKMKAYKNGRSSLKTGTIKVFYEVDRLNLDGNIYNTIKTKLIDIN